MSKSPVKKPSIKKSFRLYDFVVIDDFVKDGSASGSGSGSDEENLGQSSSNVDKQFIIQMFGINEKGETCCLYMQEYQPFFYIKVGDNWTNNTMNALLREIQDKIGKYFQDSIVSCELVDHYKLYGFSGGKKCKFVKIVFKNTIVMNKVKNLWYAYPKAKEQGNGQKSERTERYRVKFIFQGVSLELYESNIPPLLRYFHIRNISPSGWVSFRTDRAIRVLQKNTTCTYEYICPLNELVPEPEKETRVPYKICSFDIEASSSHGDFPVPVKTYKRLATNLVDAFLKQAACLNMDKQKASVMLLKIMYAAFEYGKFDEIDVVYPKEDQVISKETVKDLVNLLLKMPLEEVKTVDGENKDRSYIMTIDAMFEKIKEDADGQGTEGDDGEAAGPSDDIPTYFKKKDSIQSKKIDKKTNIIDFLLNSEYARDEKIQTITDVFTRSSKFPELKGDEVTFIGSTFLRYGETEPYLNHCIVVGDCDQIDGAVIESVKTEEELLLKWTETIQRENPDIIIGYNIFGFDYEFMFRRAQENHCEREFLKLSKKTNELCATVPRDDPSKIEIENTKLVIASGEYDLRFFKMTGRLQVDMYAYFRRDFNLASYKLDDVAGEFISDNIKKIVCAEHSKFGEVTELYSQNLMGLHVGDFIHIGFVGFTSDYYKDGKKFRILDIERGREDPDTKATYNVILIGGHEHIDSAKQIKWTMAKDDVTPQDIFRLAKGDSSDRAIVAKYCIQDCNLVHHLMNKIDVITGYVEMSSICSVPISFLVFRGQGIKLTSYVAKKCREKDTLMPDIEKSGEMDGYEGAIVLPPKCSMYMDNPVACVDYASLYPSSMISQNYSHDSKVWSKEYDLEGNQIKVTGQTDSAGNFMYDNMPGFHYIDMEFDTFKYIRKSPTSKAEKTKAGKIVCRWAQFPDNKKGVMPSILEELLKARAFTRKLIKTTKDPFMQNILDKRQLGYKVTANSLYGQCGSRTSTFYEKDVAAATTATGRMMIIYAKRMIEEVYGDLVYETALQGPVKCKAEYVYGDSVANYTPIYIRKTDGTFDICTIEQLCEKYGNGHWLPCLEEGKQEKEVCELNGIETWTEKGWTALYRVIRHVLAPDKKMIRILTHTGVVDVTDDHSLVSANGLEISPKDVCIGTELLHNDLPQIPTNIESKITKEEAEIMGFFFGDGSCGEYYCASGKKNSWALNNASMVLIHKYIDLCKIAYPNFEWVWMDTLESSGVYKISPRCKKYGSIADFVKLYRSKMYNNNAKIIPNEILSSSKEVRQAFWNGMYDADGDKDKNGYVRIDQKNQISAAYICMLASSLDYKLSLNTRSDKPDIYRVTLTKKTQRKNPIAIKKMHEIPYEGYVYDLTTSNHHFAAGVGKIIVHNTDSVFFTFNLENPNTGEKIRGKPALEATIEIAQDVAALCTRYLKPPMELTYEKTLMPFILLSKKRYVGMLYETDANKGKLKFMGLSLKRRDSCDYLKDVYGGILKILMDTKRENTIKVAIDYLNDCLQELVNGNVPMDKLMITKALRSDYKNPATIAHKVLADRIGKRDPGNKPKPGDRMKFVHFVCTESKGKKALQGEKIETPEFILQNNLQIDYNHYITNQLMKPLQQLFGLALIQIWELQNKKTAIKTYEKEIDKLVDEFPDMETFMKKKEKYCSAKVKALLFDKVLDKIHNTKHGIQTISSFFKPM